VRRWRWKRRASLWKSCERSRTSARTAPATRVRSWWARVDDEADEAALALELAGVAGVEEELALHIADVKEVHALVDREVRAVVDELAHVDELGEDHVLEAAAVGELGEAAGGVVGLVHEEGLDLGLLLVELDVVGVELGDGGHDLDHVAGAEAEVLAVEGFEVFELEEVLEGDELRPDDGGRGADGGAGEGVEEGQQGRGEVVWRVPGDLGAALVPAVAGQEEVIVGEGGDDAAAQVRGVEAPGVGPVRRESFEEERGEPLGAGVEGGAAVAVGVALEEGAVGVGVDLGPVEGDQLQGLLDAVLAQEAVEELVLVACAQEGVVAGEVAVGVGELVALLREDAQVQGEVEGEVRVAGADDAAEDVHGADEELGAVSAAGARVAEGGGEVVRDELVRDAVHAWASQALSMRRRRSTFSRSRGMSWMRLGM
jgi:hypothetical protein